MLVELKCIIDIPEDRVDDFCYDITTEIENMQEKGTGRSFQQIKSESIATVINTVMNADKGYQRYIVFKNAECSSEFFRVHNISHR